MPCQSAFLKWKPPEPSMSATRILFLRIYGVVTDGVLCQFVSLENNIATIDSTLYPFEGGGMIVGISEILCGE